jgi:cytochrome c oxidase subunit II
LYQQEEVYFKGEGMRRKHLFLVLLASILTVSGLSCSVVRAQEASRRIEITAKRFAFEPGEITLKKGQPVILVVKSNDVAHGLRIRDLNVELRVPASGKAEAQFTPQKTGDFVGHCSVFCGSGHGEMALTIHVVD